MRDWHVGMKVVCINDTPAFTNPLRIKKGEIYTIRGFDANPPFVLIDMILGLGVYLEEIHQDLSPATGKEFSFYAWRFKPLEKSKKEVSIEVFQKILDKVNVKEEEKV